VTANKKFSEYVLDDLLNNELPHHLLEFREFIDDELVCILKIKVIFKVWKIVRKKCFEDISELRQLIN
jgi:hypothetical protein